MKKLCLSIVATSGLLNTLSMRFHSAEAQVTPIEEKTYIQGNKISSQYVDDGTTYCEEILLEITSLRQKYIKIIFLVGI